MAALNKVMLIGNLGRDPEVRVIPSGAKVATFSIATTERFTSQSGERQEKTEWHNIVVWRRLAEIVEQYTRKGSQIFVEGKLTTRSWDDPQTGKKNYKTEIVANTIQLLGGRNEGGGNQSSGQGYGQNSGANSGGGSGGYGSSSAPGAPEGYENMPPADEDLPF
jgi:single-strand DNA-binding protein